MLCSVKLDTRWLLVNVRRDLDTHMHTTAFLTRHLPVVSRIGRTEYQLLLTKASDRGRNVKFLDNYFARV